MHLKNTISQAEFLLYILVQPARGIGLYTEELEYFNQDDAIAS